MYKKEFPFKLSGNSFSFIDLSVGQQSHLKADSRTFALCGSLHIGLHNVGHSRDELPIGGFATAGGDGVAEVFLQNVQVSPGPGNFD